MCRSLQISDLDNEARKSKGVEYNDDVTYNNDDVQWCAGRCKYQTLTQMSDLNTLRRRHQMKALWAQS